MPSCDTTKSVKQANSYNAFIGKMLSQIHSEYPELSKAERMKLAQQLYRDMQKINAF